MGLAAPPREGTGLATPPRGGAGRRRGPGTRIVHAAPHRFLLAQSDIFGHFGAGAKAAATKKKPAAGLPSPSKRRARSVEEDDQEVAALQRADTETTTRLLRQPSNITGGTMRPYQLEGLNWMIRLYDHGMNGILADEMGLGKTLQTISVLAWMKEARDVSGPHIVLVLSPRGYFADGSRRRRGDDADIP